MKRYSYKRLYLFLLRKIELKRKIKIIFIKIKTRMADYRDFKHEGYHGIRGTAKIVYKYGIIVIFRLLIVMNKSKAKVLWIDYSNQWNIYLL